jgi:hypothetical protein
MERDRRTGGDRLEREGELVGAVAALNHGRIHLAGLGDTTGSRYITLEQLAEFVRAGEDLRVVDNVTEQDLTAAKLAQVIFEQEKRLPGSR